jgi:hypothetical protein
MRLLLVTLAAILLLCPAPAGQALNSTEGEAVPFHISSYNTAFAMQGDFEGEYTVYPNSIEINLNRAVVRISRHCPYKGRRELAAVSFTLATPTPEGRWRKAFLSRKYVVERIMTAGDEYSLGSIHFSIPKEETTDLSQHWIVAQMDDYALDLPQNEPIEGYAYATSCRDIFVQKQTQEEQQ